MNPSVYIVQGMVQGDGTLVLEEKLALAPGPVQVTILPLPELPRDDPFWRMMRGIWEGQKARGHVPRTEGDVESERQAVREEWERRMQAIQRVQEQARQMRGPGA